MSFRTVFIRVAVIAIAGLVAVSAMADEVKVDRGSVRLDESVTITLTLEGQFAGSDRIDLGLRNLELDGEPSVSTEFSWINGAVTNRRTLRYTAHPLQLGVASVGPVVVRGEGNQQETLPAASLVVTRDELVAAGSDPLALLRELLAAGRPPCFIVAEADRTSVYEGQQVNVTWTLFNAANVQRWQIAGVPHLGDFWSEELDAGEDARERVYVGDLVMQKVAVRRVALFPLKSGRFTIGGLKASAAVLERDVDSPFGGFFEGSVDDVRVPSPPIEIEVRPLPPGPPVDLVGDVRMECASPLQRGGGPVAFAIGLSGNANLRAAAAPRFDGRVEGETEVEPMSLDVDKNAGVMHRRWRYLIFPSHAGMLTVPPLVVDIFDPVTGRREQLRCPGATLAVTRAAPHAVAAQPGTAPAARRGEELWAAIRAGIRAWLAPVLAALVLLIGLVVLVRRLLRGRGMVGRLAGDGAAPGVRARAAAMLQRRGIDPAALAREPSDRGDAWRALLSLLDAVERDRLAAGEVQKDLKRRVRDLVDAVG